jgi:hypothetical protein
MFVSSPPFTRQLRRQLTGRTASLFHRTWETEDQFSDGEIVADLMQVEQLMQHMDERERNQGKGERMKERKGSLGQWVERVTMILSLWCQGHQRTEINK